MEVRNLLPEGTGTLMGVKYVIRNQFPKRRDSVGSCPVLPIKITVFKK
jgi:hypothetical protein